MSRTPGKPRAVEVKGAQAGALVSAASVSAFAQNVEKLWREEIGTKRTFVATNPEIAPTASITTRAVATDFVFPLGAVSSIAARWPWRVQRQHDRIRADLLLAGRLDLPGMIYVRLVLDTLAATLTGAPYYSTWVALTPCADPTYGWSGGASDSLKAYSASIEMDYPTLPIDRSIALGLQAAWDPLSGVSVFQTSVSFALLFHAARVSDVPQEIT